MYVRATFNNRLAFTIYRKMAIMTVICSELTNSSNNNHIFTASNKYTAFNRGCINNTILAIININVSTYIEDKISSIFATIYIELLSFDWINWLYFKLVLLLLKIKVFWIKLFFLCPCGQNIVFWFRLWLLLYLLLWLLYLYRWDLGRSWEFIFTVEQISIHTNQHLLFLFGW